VGSASEWVTGAWEALHLMQSQPKQSFRCGPLALAKICRNYAFATAKDKSRAELLISRCFSSKKGTSLAQVQQLAQDCRMKFQVAHRSPGAEVLVPAVVHWKAGHFGALSLNGSQVKDQFLAEDTTNAFTPVVLTSTCLDLESSGFFLVPSGPLPSGWRTVSSSEASQIWGRGVPPNSDLSASTPCDQKSFDSTCADSRGMTTWNVHSLLAGLTLEDTPVGLSSAAYSLPFTLTYAHREAYQPAVFTYTNFGPKWGCNWLSYVHETTRFSGGKSYVHEAGGGATGLPV
jgi:hypothetical protein